MDRDELELDSTTILLLILIETQLFNEFVIDGRIIAVDGLVLFSFCLNHDSFAGKHALHGFKVDQHKLTCQFKLDLIRCLLTISVDQRKIDQILRLLSINTVDADVTGVGDFVN